MLCLRYDSISATTLMSEGNFTDWHTVGLAVSIDPSCEMYQWPSVPLNQSMAQRCREGSYVQLSHDGRTTQTLHGAALRAAGVLPARQVPQEPLYILLEHKISPKFGFGTPNPDYLPATMQAGYAYTISLLRKVAYNYTPGYTPDCVRLHRPRGCCCR